MAKKVLVAADDAEVMLQIQALLSRLGYDLVSAVREPVSVVGEPKTEIRATEGDDEHAELRRKLTRAERMGALGELFPGLYNDLTTNLLTILGFSELAEEPGEEAAAIREYLEFIRLSAERSCDALRRTSQHFRKNLADFPERVRSMASFELDELKTDTSG